MNISCEASRVRSSNWNEPHVVEVPTTEPDDNELEDGQVLLWFDPTAGNAKVMFKGKDEDGTVVTASISLA